MGTGNYSATSNNMKLVHWPLMGELLYLVQRGWDWARPQPAQALLAVPNVTAHPSTATVPITVLLYNSKLLCSINVGIKELISLLLHSDDTDRQASIKHTYVWMSSGYSVTWSLFSTGGRYTWPHNSTHRYDVQSK